MTSETKVQVRERPILFSTLLVYGLLEDRKTQTRRLNGLEDLNTYPGVTSGQHPLSAELSLGYQGLVRSSYYLKDKKGYAAQPGLFHEVHGTQPHARLEGTRVLNIITLKCPYGSVGDRLWVRETTLDVESHGYLGPVYLASEAGEAALEGGFGPAEDDVEVQPHEIKLRPSIFMRRQASRLSLEITAVRLERLHEITEEDARAEGVGSRAEFEALWKQINGEASWDANPWVWVVGVKRVQP